MFLTKEQIESRLNSKDNLVNRLGEAPSVRVVKHRGALGGKTEGRKNMTEEEREDCGTLSRLAGNAIAAEVYGVHPTVASNLGHGRVAGEIKPQLKAAVEDRIGKVRETVEEKAAERLLKALEYLSDDKLSAASAKDLSSIASNMSKTVTSIRPRDAGSKNSNSGPNVNILIHAPKPAREEHFEVIEVGA